MITKTPRTKDEWTALYKNVPYMSEDACYDALAANGLRLPGYTLLELRKELSNLCLENGANRFVW